MYTIYIDFADMPDYISVETKEVVDIIFDGREYVSFYESPQLYIDTLKRLCNYCMEENILHILPRLTKILSVAKDVHESIDSFSKECSNMTKEEDVVNSVLGIVEQCIGVKFPNISLDKD